MADDTSAALIAQLDVKFDQLAANMKKGIAVFNNGGLALEKRQAQIKANLSNWAIDFSGLSGLKTALLGLSAVGIVGGIADIIKKSLDAASAIGDVAKQSGVSVEFLQQLRYAASQSGASFDILDEGLTNLNKNIGEFVNTGAGRAAAAFKQLNLTGVIESSGGDTQKVFNALVTNIQKVGSESQKSSLMAKLFGQEAGPKLLQTVEQGTNGLAALEAQAISLGVVLSTQTVQGAKDANDKLDALFNVIKAEGISAVANLAPEIADLAQQITKGLPDLVTWVEKWADFFGLIKLDPVEKLKTQIQDAQDEIIELTEKKANNTGTWNSLSGIWNSLFGLSDSDYDTLIGAAKAKLKQAQTDLSIAPVTVTPQVKDTYQPPVKIATTDAEKAAAQRQKELLAQTVLDAKTAAAALAVAQDQTNAQLLKGSAGYYDAIQKQTEDEYNAKVAVATAERDKQLEQLNKQGKDWAGYAAGVANINQALNDKIAAADEERKQKEDETSPTGQILRQAIQDGQTQILQYEQQTGALGLATAALAKYNYVQDQYNKYREAGIPLTQAAIDQISKEGDAVAAAAQSNKNASDIMSANVQIADNLRDGLVDIGVTAVTQASNFKQAVGNMLLSLAQLIVKLELTKVAQDALGESGTPLTGFLGTLFGSVSSVPADVGLSFATGGYTGTGGKNEPAGIVHKGEYVFDQDAVQRIGVGKLMALQRGYANGGPVGFSVPSIPSISPRAGNAALIVNNYDLSGAVVTDELFAQVSRVADQRSAAQLAQYDKTLPTKVARLRDNPRLR